MRLKYEPNVKYIRECKKQEQNILTFSPNACIIDSGSDMSKTHESGRRTLTRISQKANTIRQFSIAGKKRSRAELRIHIQDERTDYVK